VVLRAVAAGLRAAGRDVIDLGLATPPATQLAVEHLRAAGGVILTASHNPAEWNALKFLSSAGEFLGPEQGAAVRSRWESDRDLWVEFAALGGEREEHGALDWHIERVLQLDLVDVAAIRARALRVAVDGCASVGGIAVPRLLRELGATVVELDCVPNSAFTRAGTVARHLWPSGASSRPQVPTSACARSWMPTAPVRGQSRRAARRGVHRGARHRGRARAARRAGGDKPVDLSYSRRGL
jgi:hypothetical protein